jgi:hypothetical protein
LSLNAEKIEYLRRGFVAAVLDSASHGVLNGLIWFFVLFFLTLVLRKEWLVCAIILVLGTLVFSRQTANTSPLQLTCVAAEVAINLFVVLRFGLPAFWATLLFQMAAHRTALTLDLSAWFASNGGVAMLVLSAVAVYAFVVSLGDRPLLGKAFFAEG